MKNYHHTNADALDLTRVYKQTFFKKPLGLWYGMNDSWEKFCEIHASKKIRKNKFLLDIDKSRMIIIDSIEKLDAFIAEFYELVGVPKLDIRFIIWERVAQKYSGIEMMLTQEDLPEEEQYYWVFGWDVASGCVWDLSIIKSAVKTNTAIETLNK